MENKNNACVLFLLGCCVYELLSALSDKGSVFQSVIIGGLVAYSLYSFVICHLRYKLPKPMNYLSLLFFISCLYGILLLLSSDRFYIREGFHILQPNDSYIKGLLISITPLFSFYKFSKERELNLKKIRITILILVFITILSYYKNYFALFQEFNSIFTNNIAYSFVLLMPFAFFISEKRYAKYLFLFFCYGFVLFGAKRGAIIIGFICILYCLWNDFNNVSVLKKTVVLALSLIAFTSFLYAFSLYMEDAWEHMLTRMEYLQEGDVGHRELLFNKFWYNFIYRSDIAEQLLGHGANATLKIYDNFAHNDWLELLTNQGIFSVLFYGMYFVSFFKMARINHFENDTLRVAFMIIFIILFVRTWFSMSLSTITIPLNLMLGYLYAGSNSK